jgi:hypothetical protein
MGYRKNNGPGRYVFWGNAALPLMNIFREFNDWGGV